jgi:phosphotransferase system  glucose/maltose/N-acetylglucosamine-specific IIC component
MNAFREIPSSRSFRATVQTGARTDQAAKEKRRMTSCQDHFISAENSFMTFIVPSIGQPGLALAIIHIF